MLLNCKCRKLWHAFSQKQEMVTAFYIFCGLLLSFGCKKGYFAAIPNIEDECTREVLFSTLWFLGCCYTNDAFNAITTCQDIMWPALQVRKEFSTLSHLLISSFSKFCNSNFFFLKYFVFLSFSFLILVFSDRKSPNS